MSRTRPRHVRDTSHRLASPEEESAALEREGGAYCVMTSGTTSAAKTTQGLDVRFTSTDDALFVTLLETPTTSTIEVRGLQAGPGTEATLLGVGSLDSTFDRGRLTLSGVPDRLPIAPAHVVKVTPKPTWIG